MALVLGGPDIAFYALVFRSLAPSSITFIIQCNLALIFNAAKKKRRFHSYRFIVYVSCVRCMCVTFVRFSITIIFLCRAWILPSLAYNDVVGSPKENNLHNQTKYEYSE